MCNNREQKKRSFVFKRTLKCSIYAIFLIFSLSAFVYFLICNLLNFYELLFPNFFTLTCNVQREQILIRENFTDTNEENADFTDIFAMIYFSHRFTDFNSVNKISEDFGSDF